MSYPSSTYTFTKNTAITNLTPSVTGTVASYSISPSLPAGLSFATSTGIISGTPSAVSSSNTYTLTATNTTGSTTYQFTIIVQDAAPNTYSVIYNGNGNTSGSVPIDSNNYVVGSNANILNNTGSLVKTSYVFDGWNSLSDGTGINYTATSSLVISSNNITLYAKWISAPIITLGNYLLSTTTAVINWTTDANSTDSFSFGNDTTYKNVALVSGGQKIHNVSLSELVPGAVYFYKINSTSTENGLTSSYEGFFRTSMPTANSASTAVLPISASGTNVPILTQLNTQTISLNSGSDVAVVQFPASAISTSTVGVINNDLTSTTTASLTADVSIKIEKLDTDYFSVVNNGTGLQSLANDVYRIEATQQIGSDTIQLRNFAKSLVISLNYSDSDVISANLQESSLTIRRYDVDTGWSTLNNCTVDTSVNVVSCNTDHLSDFALFGTEKPVISSGGGGGGGGNGYSYNLYSVIYYSNGSSSGIAPIDSANYSLNSNVFIASNTGLLKKNNYVFNGWNTLANGAGINYAPGSIIKISSNLNLYSRWNLIATSSEPINDSSSVNTTTPVISTPSSTSTLPIINNKMKIPASFHFSQNLKLGSKNNEVLYLQYFLNNYGYEVKNPNAYFGAQTKAALIKFQKDKGLSTEYQTGNFYVKTRELVNNLLNKKNVTVVDQSVTPVISTPSSTSTLPIINNKMKIPASFHFSQNLKLGSKNNEVLYLQYFLNNYGYEVKNPNAYFGAQTKAALIKFQKDKGLSTEYQTGNFYVKTRELVNNLLNK